MAVAVDQARAALAAFRKVPPPRTSPKPNPATSGPRTPAWVA